MRFHGKRWGWLLLLGLLTLVPETHSQKGKPPKPKPTPRPSPTATPTPAPTPQPTPLGDAWITYGHDAQRTGSSQASITSLSFLWRYRPAKDAWAEACGVHHAVASSAAIYARWLTCSEGASNTDKVGLQGQRVWRAYSGLNWDKRHWPAISLDGSRIYGNDDRVFVINATTGATTYLGIDTWGEVLPTQQGFVTVNMHHQVEPSGFQQPDVWLGSFSNTLQVNWKNVFHTTAYGPDDLLGGALALSGDTLYRASTWANFDAAPTPPAGLEAFSLSGGQRKWAISTTPTSRISVDESKVYLIEGASTHVSKSLDVLSGVVLVARSQVDGAVVWSQPVQFPITYSTWKANPDGTYTKVELRGTHVQAPVLTGELVIIATESGVRAFNRTTGAPVWATPLTATAKQEYGTGYTECATTTLAAASGSQTLLVTASSGLYLLSLQTGITTWANTTPYPSQVGGLRNPILVGKRAYVVDGSDSTNGGLIALESP